MTGQRPYAVRLSPPAAKVLAALPEREEQMVLDVLDAAAGHPWGFPQRDAGDLEGEDVHRVCRPAVGHLLRQPCAQTPVRPGTSSGSGNLHAFGPKACDVGWFSTHT
ncbi:hypothetical protein GCM10010255_80330 [Streptomyces coeruleofuscus]|uniref:Uncharacterized protein n=1 Tax=Streptomyces coeruleofuscus TaxID=66879 RepID=A0ABN3JC34_9ACTN